MLKNATSPHNSTPPHHSITELYKPCHSVETTTPHGNEHAATSLPTCIVTPTLSHVDPTTTMQDMPFCATSSLVTVKPLIPQAPLIDSVHDTALRYHNPANTNDTLQRCAACAYILVLLNSRSDCNDHHRRLNSYHPHHDEPPIPASPPCHTSIGPLLPPL
jgi:hypothetical protein